MTWSRQIRPIIDVYQNIETGVYYVQPFTEGPVATTAFGDPTIIASDEFDEMIVHAVIENLNRFGREKFDPRRAPRLKPAEQRNFIKMHVGVGVRKELGGELIVRPLHRERGGFVAFDRDAITLAPEEVPNKLKSAIAEAFRRAR